MVVTFSEMESGMLVAGGWGKGRMRSYCLTGTEFQVWKRIKF